MDVVEIVERGKSRKRRKKGKSEKGGGEIFSERFSIAKSERKRERGRDSVERGGIGEAVERVRGASMVV